MARQPLYVPSIHPGKDAIHYSSKICAIEYWHKVFDMPNPVDHFWQKYHDVVEKGENLIR